jgi:hypothetical protein
MRRLIWRFYADLKRYRANPNPVRRLSLRARFDRIFRRRTGFVTPGRLLARLHANKAELLTVPERPERPLRTNRLGERHPRPCHRALARRRDAQRHRARLPRCLLESRKDLRQAGRRLLVLSSKPAQRRSPGRCSAARRPCPMSRSARLRKADARGFAALAPESRNRGNRQPSRSFLIAALAVAQAAMRIVAK